MLLAIFALIFWAIKIEIDSAHFRWKALVENLVVPIVLLLNHITFQFSWSKPIGLILKITSFFCIVIGGYIIYSSR